MFVDYMLELFEYQRKLVDQVKGNDNWALFVTPGAGKTLMALTIIEYKKYQNLVIICRKNKIKEWSNDVKDMKGINVVVINFESLHKLEELMDCKALKPFVLIDESQNIKSAKRDSKRWQMLKKLKRYGCNFGLLSGTPQHNEYLDYYTSLHLLDLYPYSLTAFKNEFCVYIQYPGQTYKVLHKYINVNERILNGLFKDSRIGWLHVNPLHPPNFYDVEFKRSEVVRDILKKRVYKELLLDTPGKVALYTRLMEAGIIGGDIIDEVKLDYICSQILGKYKKLVIFTNYIREVEMVAERLDMLGIAYNMFTGSRKDIITENIVLVNVNAGGSGMNDLADYDCAVFHSIPVKYIEMEQSIGRVSRIGQTKKPDVYFMMMPDEKKRFKEHIKRLEFDGLTFNI